MTCFYFIIIIIIPYHHYAGYLQLYIWSKACLYGIWCCSYPIVTVCATCNVIAKLMYLYTITLLHYMCSAQYGFFFSSSLISSFSGTLLRYCLSDLRWFQLLQLLPLSYYYYYMAFSAFLLGHVLSDSGFSRQQCYYVKHPHAQAPNARPGYLCLSNS